MGFGILEPRGTRHVPGTAKLIDDDSSEVVLVPHPSRSPNDPLNWPTWKKDMAIFSIALLGALGAIQGTALVVATGVIAVEFDVPITRAETTNTYWFLSTGVVCIFGSVTSRLIGKRPIYLLSAALLLASAIWNATATSFSSVLASRILYGVGLGAFESLPWASIGDMYFVHQRGRRVAAMSFMGLGVYQLGPVLGGYIVDTYGWRINLWMIVAFDCVATLLLIFFCPETSYIRPLQYETDIIAPSELPMRASLSTDSSSPVPPATEGPDSEKGMTVQERTRVTTSDEMQERPITYLQGLKPYRGIESNENVFQLTLRFFTMGLYPIVWFVFFLPNVFLGWIIAINTVLAQLFTLPPLNFTPTKLGYVNTFTFPASIAAWAFTHLLADRLATRLARRNNRTFEPEFRLPLLLPALIISPMAFALFGWYNGTLPLEGHHISWVASSFIYGLTSFSLINLNVVTFSYLLDSHRDIAVEAGVFAIMLRNFFGYGAASFMAPWLEHSGVAHTFYELAGLDFGLILVLSVFFYIYGKKMRAFMAKHDPLKWLGVEIKHKLQ